MMKNLIIATCAVLGITALNACSLQEIPDTPAPTAETITVTAYTAEEQTGTKTTLSGLETHWVKDVDKIGIFSPQAAGQKNNVPYTAQSNGKTSDFTGSLVWGAGEHEFCAYYPYNSGYTGDREAIPFSIPSEQTQSAADNTDHIGALDYMVASRKVSPTGPVNFNFVHLFTMIEFQIKGSGTLKKIRLTGPNLLACTNSEIKFWDDLSATTNLILSNAFNYVTVTLTTPAILSDSPTSVYMMVVPRNHSEDLRIALNFNDGTWKEITKAPPTTTEGGSFFKGFQGTKKYVVTLDTADSEWYDVFEDSRDHQLYPYVTIGSQVWMKRNLAYLPEVYLSDSGSDTDPRYYVYGFERTNVAEAKITANYYTYGVLYNRPAAMNGAASSNSNPSGVQGICPDGWHLPSNAEWVDLRTHLGIESSHKMRETGTTHWTAPNTGATNESGFTALPGGRRETGTGPFSGIGNSTYWWTSTEESSTFAVFYIHYDSADLKCLYVDANFRDYGFSVRCIKD